ncbi:IclR family transcriptional regulator [Nocardioides sp.]|uniref:IclR family transcriptional regulator n=1 Tax=Nocardioides sp. TaxID=35761 RepID=UPI00261B6076|nr:IclR family transcriptional regulator [Nocardioides sp.]MDI6908208.1 IclR family transcriptional regulator [Nocardioides sp.]
MGGCHLSQSLERAVLLIEELSKRPQRLGELAEVLGTHKSTVLRTLQLLERYGWVRREGDLPVFSLGLRLVGLSNSILDDLDIRKVARPQLDRLGSGTKETVHLGVMDGTEMVYLDKVESVHPVRMYSRIGARAPLHCTGVGKVLLAYTPVEDWPALELRRFTDRTIVDREDLVDAGADIRGRGWGWDEEEHEDGVRCIAAPVFGPDHEIMAAVSVSVPTSRLSAKQLRSHVSLLLDVTGRISASLGGAAPVSV